LQIKKYLQQQKFEQELKRWRLNFEQEYFGCMLKTLAQTVLWSWWESNPRPDKESVMPSTCLVLLRLSGCSKVQAGPVETSLFVLSYSCITTLQEPDLHDDVQSLTRQIVGLTEHLVT